MTNMMCLHNQPFMIKMMYNLEIIGVIYGYKQCTEGPEYDWKVRCDKHGK